MAVNTNKVDISSFMGVINHTVQTAEGIEFEGKHMPNGVPVKSAGVTKAMLMKDRGMAEGWYEAIKGEYERQINQVNHERSTADTPELVIRGEASAPAEPRRSEPPAPEYPQGIEAQLQASCARWESQLSKLDSRLADLEVERREAARALRKAEAALQAVLGVDGDE